MENQGSAAHIRRPLPGGSVILQKQHYNPEKCTMYEPEIRPGAATGEKKTTDIKKEKYEENAYYISTN